LNRRSLEIYGYKKKIRKTKPKPTKVDEKPMRESILRNSAKEIPDCLPKT